MPIDPSIPLQVRAPQIDSPVDVYGKVFQLQGMQQSLQNNQALEEERRQKIAANDRALALNDQVNQLVQHAMVRHPDGYNTYDRNKLRELFTQARIPLPSQEQAFKSLDEVDASLKKHAETTTDSLADIAHSVLQNGATPTALTFGIALAKANHRVSDEDVAPLLQLAAAGGDLRGPLMQIRGLSEKYKDQGKPVTLAEGATLVNPQTGEVVARGGPKPPTEAVLDARYQALQQKVALHQPLTTEEQAEITAYEKRKVQPGIDRQTAAINAATTQQARAQTFQEQQAGRKELTEKVEAPFRQAQQSAQELRDLVHAAQAGNKEAASLQALQATMSTVRANGLNRLNQAEMNLPAHAGSLWDTIQNKVGKLASGQPIDASLQKDLVEYADLIEKGAYNRYKTGHADVTTRYKLTGERPAAPPGAPAEGTERTNNGKNAVWKLGPDGWGWYAK